MMKKIKTQGTEFFISLESDINLIEFPFIADNPWELKLTEVYKGDDVRLTIIPFLKKGHGLLSWLYFRDDRALDGLDERILNNSYKDEDFERAVKTQHQISWCQKCERRYHTLIITPNDLYPGNQTLYLEKIKYFSPFLRCPFCNSSFRLLVVKIISEVE